MRNEAIQPFVAAVDAGHGHAHVKVSGHHRDFLFANMAVGESRTVPGGDGHYWRIELRDLGAKGRALFPELGPMREVKDVHVEHAARNCPGCLSPGPASIGRALQKERARRELTKQRV